ncbi:MAG: TOBE domain-containing protein, partial [Deltaproteobacteria bacterium]|nr:TOBE domain-containing protein [Deltaproteobacteria bacterium]
IIDDGRLVQVAAPQQILRCPATPFVARFTRTRNLLPGRAEPAADGALVRIEGGPELRSTARQSGPVIAAIRPESIALLGAGDNGPADNRFDATVRRCTPRLTHVELELDAGMPLIAHLAHAAAAPEIGSRVRVAVSPAAVWLLPVATA